MRTPALLAAIATVAGCAFMGEREVEGPPRKENVFAITETQKLIAFNAGQPRKVTTVGTVKGMQAGEVLVGIDFRVARGILFGLGSSGRLYTIDTRSADAKAVGEGPLAIRLSGAEFGFDFNPTVDRIRIVSDTGQNMRAHPDTGVSVDGNPNEQGTQPDGLLAYAPGDSHWGRKPRLVAAGYTYNKQNDKLTTNFAIDAATGALVTQGSREGTTPAVSPNTGQLYTVGSLGVSDFAQAQLDIGDLTGAAFAAINLARGTVSRFYLVNLENGAATFIGTIGGGERVRGIAIEP